MDKNDFEPKFGKKKDKKGIMIGWKGKYFDITFSMSSQLWYHFSFIHIKKYIIDTIVINTTKKTISYADIYDLYKLYN